MPTPVKALCARDVPSRVRVLGRVRVLNQYNFDLFCFLSEFWSKLGLYGRDDLFFCSSPNFKFIF